MVYSHGDRIPTLCLEPPLKAAAISLPKHIEAIAGLFLSSVEQQDWTGGGSPSSGRAALGMAEWFQGNLCRPSREGLKECRWLL